MLERYLGADRFRDGVRLYMRRHREANAIADDLWGALGEASGQPILEMADSWIRKTGYPLVNVALATEGEVAVELTQRRFFSDSGGAASAGDGAATKWLVPVVLRFRDLKGVKEQPVLLSEASARVKLEAEGLVSWCIGNSDARGFYRTNYDDATLARLLPAVAELRPAERIALISDQWALVRADQAPIERFLDLVVSLRGEEDHVVLDEVVGRLGLIEHRFLADEDRAAFGALITGLYGERAAKLGWSPAAGEDDEVRLRRAVLLRALIVTARDPGTVAEAEKRLPAAGAGGGDVDPNLLDVVVTAAARRASEPRFEDLRARVKSETDPASKRRYLHALARAEEGRLPARAVALALRTTSRCRTSRRT